MFARHERNKNWTLYQSSQAMWWRWLVLSCVQGTNSASSAVSETKWGKIPISSGLRWIGWIGTRLQELASFRTTVWSTAHTQVACHSMYSMAAKFRSSLSCRTRTSSFYFYISGLAEVEGFHMPAFTPRPVIKNLNAGKMSQDKNTPQLPNA